ncbi:MAG: hypothetical protein FWG54_03870, partial [Bacteroidetes bacterium]|nr:hypothetical protein [Bacteroidota bacterium]
MIGSLPVAAYLVLQLPAVQSRAAAKAASMLSENLGTEVFVEKVYYAFFKKIILQNVYILSTPIDTLLQVNKLSITPAHIRFFSKNLSFKKIVVQGGVFNLCIEEQETNLERVFKIKKRAENAPKDTLPKLWVMALTDFSLKDFRFSLRNEKRPQPSVSPAVMNFTDLEVSHINLEVKNIRFADNTLFCSIKSMNAQEKSGYTITNITGELAVSGTQVRIDDLIAQDACSDLRADVFYMHYNSARDFQRFTENVGLEADFKNARLSFASLSFYAPALEKSTLEIAVTGHVAGPVRSLQSEGVQLHTLNGQTTLEASFNIRGLPSIPNTTTDLNIRKLCSTAGDAAATISQLIDLNTDSFAAYLPPHLPFSFQGQLVGLFHHFDASGTLSSDMGNIQLQAVLYREKERGFHVDGHIAAQELSLGEWIGKPFGTLNMEAHARTLLRSPARGGMEADIDSLRIFKLEINDYPLSNILAIGLYKDKCFDGRVACSDPNLRFLFQGLTNLVRYNFYANVAYADLAALGLDKRDSVSRISGEILANFEREATGDIDGTIALNRTYYTNSSGIHDLKSITINSHIQDSLYRFELSAPFAEARYTGSKGMLSFVKDFRRTALSRYLPHYFEPEPLLNPNRQYHLDMTIGDMRAIGQLALPGLYIAPNTRLTANITPQDSIRLQLDSRSLRYYEQRANNLSLFMEGDSTALHGILSATGLQTYGLLIDTLALHTNAAHNQVDAALSYQNFTGQNRDGSLNALVAFGEPFPDNPHPVSIHILPSYFVINNTPWQLDPSSIVFASTAIRFEQLNLHHKEQSLKLNGNLNRTLPDTLHIALNQFDISLFNLFLEKSPYKFSGLCTGDAQIIDYYHDRQFIADLKASEIFVNQLAAGALSVGCQWDQEGRRFVMDAQNVQQGKNPVGIKGFY